MRTDPPPPRRGTCPWCGRHQTELRFTPYTLDGRYHAEYICEICREAFDWSLRQKITGGEKDGGGERR